MQTVIDALRTILGEPDFWKQLPSNSSSGYTSYQWDYGAMIEYVVAAIIVCIVVASVFKFIRNLVK